MKKIIKGTGITEREVVVFETRQKILADLRANPEHINKPESFFEEYIRNDETWKEQRDHYREVAETFNDHKNWFERIIYMNGIETWVEHVTKDYDEKKKDYDEKKINNEPTYDDDSELDFAIQIRSLIKIIRSALEKNDCDEVCRFAMEFGETFTAIRFKFNWEKPALMGESHSKSQSERAQHPRSKINVDGEKFSINSIVIKLAKKKDEWGYVPTKDLWNELFSELDKKHLKPVEKSVGKEEIIHYSKDDDGNFDEIKFSSFKTMISTKRNKKLT